jgi:hypothetical protein
MKPAAPVTRSFIRRACQRGFEGASWRPGQFRSSTQAVPVIGHGSTDKFPAVNWFGQIVVRASRYVLHDKNVGRVRAWERRSVRVAGRHISNASLSEPLDLAEPERVSVGNPNAGMSQQFKLEHFLV